MDLSFFGLTAPAFDNTPNPSGYVALRSHRRAIVTLRYAVENRKGVVLLTGPPGTGKTLMTRLLRDALGPHAAVAFVTRPCRTEEELWLAIADGFRLHPQNDRPFKSPAHALEQFAESLYQQDVPAVLVLDNAHELPDAALHLVRQLAALEADDMPLIQIVLVGWPKLATRFFGLAGTALQQRIFRHVRLAPLSDTEASAYVRGRIRLVGGPEEGLFDDAALAVIRERTGGIPRLMNALCETLLLDAYRATCRTISAERARTIPFEQNYDPAVYEAQLAADDAGVLFNAQLKEHPLIQQITARLCAVESAAADERRDIEDLRTREPAIARQLRRYDRIFDRMVPLLRKLNSFRQESLTVLAECRTACDRLNAMLAEPRTMMDRAKESIDRLDRSAAAVHALLRTLGPAREQIERQVQQSDQAAQRLARQLGDALPTMERTQRMLGLLRKVHAATYRRCQSLETLTARVQELCESAPRRVAELEEALIEPERMLDRLRTAERRLNRRLDDAPARSRSVEAVLDRAADAAARIREAIGEADPDAADAIVAAPSPPAPEPARDSLRSLTQRVQQLRERVGRLREPSPAPEVSND